MVLSKSRYIQLIRVSRARLNLSRLIYKNFLYSLTGKSHCHAMSIAELSLVFYQMKRLSIKLVAKRGQVKRNPVYTNHKAFVSPLEQLRQLWFLMSVEGYLSDNSDKSLLAWSIAQIKYLDKPIPVDRLEWLPIWVIAQLFEELKKQYELCQKGIKKTLES